MSKFMGSKTMRAVVSAGMLAVLAACGGGGGGDGVGSSVSVSGTAAKGAALGPNAAVSMTCANGAVITGTTDSGGKYTSSLTTIMYPCVGKATLGSISYRGVLAKGTTANFTPLTDVLVETMLAASSSGSTALTLDQFIAKIRSDFTFAASVSSDTSMAGYRAAALAVVKAALIASGMSEAEANATIAAASGVSFEAVLFGIGSPLDLVLDNTASVLLTNGVVKASVLSSAKAAGDALPTPNSGGTGGTGGTGGSGSGN